MLENNMFLTHLSTSFERQVRRDQSWTLEDFLKECRTNVQLTASTASRMSTALGEGESIRTSQDPRLQRLFGDRVLKRYSAFNDFYGLETVIEEIVRYYYLAAQGLETRKKILCLIGPTGTAKSMLARRLKTIFGQTSMYVLAIKKGDAFELSPVFEHPFDLFDREAHGDLLAQYKIKPYQLGAGGPSPWAWKHLREFNGDVGKFHVVQVPCSVGQQVGIARIEPETDRQLDVTALIGARNDDGSYRYTGGLNRSGQGILEFVEMLKVKHDVLRPLLTAMEEGFYSGHGGIGTIPFRGMVLCHSNEPEWEAFRKKDENRGLVDRILLVRVPYCMQFTEEARIYDQMLAASELGDKPRAPHTTTTLARLTVLSRLRPTGTHATIEMMRVYDGEDSERVGKDVKTLAKYREERGPNSTEGRDGISTRSAFLILSDAFMADPEEIGADPTQILERALVVIKRDYGDDPNYKRAVGALLQEYLDKLERDIKLAYGESRGTDTAQNRFNRYEALARAWSFNKDEVYRDPDTMQIWDVDRLDKELARLEKAMKIEEPAEFREELVRFCLKYRAQSGEHAVVPLESHERMQELIEAKIRSEGGDLAQVIAFGNFNREDKVEIAHNAFVECMMKRGYSNRQVERLVGRYMAEKKLSFFDPTTETKKK